VNKTNTEAGELSSASRRKRTTSWVRRELAGADRAILSFVIFLDQVFLSIVCLWIGAIAPYKSGLFEFVGFFGVLGLVSAGSLFFTGFLPRVFALIWHLIFVSYVVGASTPGRESQITQWARYDLLAVFYLAVTAIVKYRTRNAKLS
jgi:hypothetical protein